MSTINEALKKAQNQRDTRRLLYGSILSTGRGKSPLFKKKHLPWLIIPVMIILGTLVSDAWLDLERVPPPQEKVPGKGESIPLESPPAEDIKNLSRLYDRGRSFHGEGRLKLAKKYYLEVLKIDPGHINAMNNLGVVCLAEKNFAEAENYFKKALNLNSGSVDPYYNLACLYSLKGDIPRGIDTLKKAIQLDQTVREWARKDRDLDGLRNVSEFTDLINQ